MSVLLSCPQGHRWETSADRADIDTCPVCGASGESVGEYDASPATVPLVDNLPPPPRSATEPPVAAGMHEQLKDVTSREDNSPANATPCGDGAYGELPNPFGRYEVIKRLGRGGMGAVYLARDVQLDRQVAIKVPRFSAHDNPRLLERFQREARAAATLDHPNICSIHDVGRIQGIDYLTMAYIEGRPLSSLIKDEDSLPQRAVADLIRKLALALEEAHRAGIVHRDLKPDNIMINQRYEPVITDFGLAHREGPQEPKLTAEGAIMGSPAYMAPEQVAGDTLRIGPATDIYGLAMVLYELLTGRLPFSGSIGEVMAQIATESPTAPSIHRPDVDAELERICLKALHKRVEERYSSMREFAEALAKYLETSKPSPRANRNSAAPTTGLGDAAGLELATELLEHLAARRESNAGFGNSTSPPDASRPRDQPIGKKQRASRHAAGLKLNAFGCSLQLAIVSMTVLVVAFVMSTNNRTFDMVSVSLPTEDPLDGTNDPGDTASQPTVADDVWDNLVPVTTRTAPRLVFARGTVELTESSEAELNKLAQDLTTRYYVLIRGNASPEGDVKQNKLLAERRAQVVEQYLIRQGVKPNRLRVDDIQESKSIPVTLEFLQLPE